MRRPLITLTLIGAFLNSCSNENEKSTQIDINRDVIHELTDSLSNNDSSIPTIDSSLIVVDTTSGLIWMKNDFGLIKKRYLNEWIEIFEYQKEINSNSYAGFDDWRVPTIAEYKTMNHNRAEREVYQELFNELDTNNVWGNGAYAFWSKSTPNKNTASYISFIDGFATSGGRGKQLASGPWKGITFAMSVRLVRN